MSPKRSGRSPGNPAKATAPEPEEESPGDVWISTEIGPDEKSYSVVLNYSGTSTTISYDRATRYAQEVLRAAHRAAYDASVVRQLTAVEGIDRQGVVELISDLRQDRPPLDDAATRPLSLAPGVSDRLEPFLVVSLDGQEVGQWDFSDAVEHATTMLALVSVAELDTGYLRALQNLVGVPREVAGSMVSDLANHRDEAW